MTRSNAREIVAHLIFEMNFTEDSAQQLVETTMAPEYYTSLAQETDVYADRPNEKQMNYIRETAKGVQEKQEELDSYIAKYAINWSVSRISKVARSVLHVAMYEALYVDDVPVNAAINEAVELVRRYEEEEVVSFVNGVLGSFARDLEKE